MEMCKKTTMQYSNELHSFLLTQQQQKKKSVFPAWDNTGLTKSTGLQWKPKPVAISAHGKINMAGSSS